MGQSLHIAEPFSNPVACLPLRFHFFFGSLPVGWDIPVVLTRLLWACRLFRLRSTRSQGLWLWRTPRSWDTERSLQPGPEPETEGCPPEPSPGNTGKAFTETLSNITGILGT